MTYNSHHPTNLAADTDTCGTNSLLGPLERKNIRTLRHGPTRDSWYDESEVGGFLFTGEAGAFVLLSASSINTLCSVGYDDHGLNGTRYLRSVCRLAIGSHFQAFV